MMTNEVMSDDFQIESESTCPNLVEFVENRPNRLEDEESKDHLSSLYCSSVI